MPKYIGPYDIVEVDGKQYHRGENVPAEGADRLRRTMNRHRFEGDEPVSAVGVTGTAPTPEHPVVDLEHGTVTAEEPKASRK